MCRGMIYVLLHFINVFFFLKPVPGMPDLVLAELLAFAWLLSSAYLSIHYPSHFLIP